MEPYMKLNLGENIRIYRKKINWTQEQLADRLGVSGQSVSRWEKGATYPDMEFLPVLAKLFGCTTDDLLGCAEPEKKLTAQELYLLLEEAVREGDGEKTVEILRTVRYDYLDEFPFLYISIVNILPGHPLYGNTDVLDEFRLAVNAYQEKGKGDLLKPNLIQALFAMEDDGKAFDLVLQRQVPAGTDLSELGLYLFRAQHRDDAELTGHMIQEKRLRDLYGFLIQPHHVLGKRPDREDPWKCEREAAPADPAMQRRISERKLKMLHDLNGITADEAHPVSGDGVLDIWCAAYLHVGFRYAAQLAVTGEQELALTALEDCAGLVEQLMVFPDGYEKFQKPCYPWDGEKLPVRTEGFETIEAYRRPYYFLLHNGRFVPGLMDISTAYKIRGVKHRRCFFHQTIDLGFESQLTNVWVPMSDLFSGWYNPIRRHPRYLAVIERIHAVLPHPTGHGCVGIPASLDE